MDLKLDIVDRDNFRKVIRLELHIPKQPEDFVAPNMYSLAESKFYPMHQPRAIILGNDIVGFVMYGPLC